MGNKAQQGEGTEAVESEANIEELSAIFSTSNFSLDVEKRDGPPILDEDDVELNIGMHSSVFLSALSDLCPYYWSFLSVCKDDIDLEEEPKERPKGQKIMTLNKQKLNSRLQAFKGSFI